MTTAEARGRADRTALASQARQMLPLIEAELQRQIARLDTAGTRPFHDMLAYHMGWKGARGRQSTGKRIRPLILLLVCKSLSGRWRHALPAAAAVEIIHDFSLVHDDIQDNSPLRRGRPALWKKHGAPLAINAGDAFFAVANLAVLEVKGSVPPTAVLRAASVLEAACVDLTRGQFLDLYHQGKGSLSLRDYWTMIEGKTAALISAAAEMGAILGGASPAAIRSYAEFGRLVGLAFQVQDDVLGIWGEEAITGKSTASDLAEGKLSLPVIYGLLRKGKFAAAWRSSTNRAHDAARLRDLLTKEGAHEYAARQAQDLTHQALDGLRAIKPRGAAGAALEELTDQLLSRKG